MPISNGTNSWPNSYWKPPAQKQANAKLVLVDRNRTSPPGSPRTGRSQGNSPGREPGRGDPDLTCDICGIQHRRWDALQAHYLDTHGVMRENPGLTCEICGVTHRTWDTMQAHLVERHNIVRGRYDSPQVGNTCEVCGTTNRSWKSLRTHLQARLGEICALRTDQHGIVRTDQIGGYNGSTRTTTTTYNSMRGGHSHAGHAHGLSDVETQETVYINNSPPSTRRAYALDNGGTTTTTKTVLYEAPAPIRTVVYDNPGGATTKRIVTYEAPPTVNRTVNVGLAEGMGTTTTRTTTYEYAPVEPQPVVNMNASKTVVVNTGRVEVAPPVVDVQRESVRTTKTTLIDLEQPPLPAVNLNSGYQTTTTKVVNVKAAEPVHIDLGGGGYNTTHNVTEVVNIQRPALHAGHANLNLGGGGLHTTNTNTVINRTVYAEDVGAKMHLNEGYQVQGGEYNTQVTKTAFINEGYGAESYNVMNAYSNQSLVTSRGGLCSGICGSTKCCAAILGTILGLLGLGLLLGLLLGLMPALRAQAAASASASAAAQQLGSLQNQFGGGFMGSDGIFYYLVSNAPDEFYFHLGPEIPCRNYSAIPPSTTIIPGADGSTQSVTVAFGSTDLPDCGSITTRFARASGISVSPIPFTGNPYDQLGIAGSGVAGVAANVNGAAKGVVAPGRGAVALLAAGAWGVLVAMRRRALEIN